ncbi:MAG: nucleotidyltransferase domain-containing protein [Defluviitaleaceae bacterium]|nr:nucleotidyltransferase domain-containing protein [Defluviitaleaceae bacterium]
MTNTPNYAALHIPPPQRYVINHIYNKLYTNPLVSAIFLFGSCADGTANNESDVDIFVVTNRSIHDYRDEAFDSIYGVTDDIPLDKYVCCDILSASVEDFQLNTTPLIRTIKNEGVMLGGIL